MIEFSSGINMGDKKTLKKIYLFFLYCFAIIGFVLVTSYFAIRLGLTNEKGVIDMQDYDFLTSQNFKSSTSTQTWSQGEEWNVLKQAIVNDTDNINKVAKDTEVDPRLIVAILVPEQLRLFHSQREIFKEILAPLKILGNQSQFSWGIMGIKKDTAIEIEKHLKDPSSPFYLGKKYEYLLEFTSNDPDQERFTRIVNEKEHYYSYLYSAIYIKEIIAQWKNTGYDISNKPEIIATLFNIGFNNSHPNSDPHSGGSQIEINNKTYSFGKLAGEFYYSSELKDYFPKN